MQLIVIDYRELENLLKAGQWQEADQETRRVMCQVAGRLHEGCLRVEDVKTFPCGDLQIIDQLWVNHSKGHFGLSVQKQIWQECNSPNTYGDDWNRFCIRVGWKNQTAKEVYYSDFLFDTQTSPKGELPTHPGEDDFGVFSIAFLFSRQDF